MGEKRKALILAFDEMTVKEAVKTVKACLPMKDEYGQPTAEALQAAKFVIEQRFGKAKQAVDMTSNGETILLHVG